MKREYGDYRCMFCRKIPDIGWIYVCTQDDEELAKEDRELEEWSNGAADLGAHWLAKAELDGITEQPPRSVTQLSPWIEEAIADGHYTAEQELILRQQKQNVNDKIAAAIQHFNETEAEAVTSSEQSPSVTANSLLPFPVIGQASDSQTDNLLPSMPTPAARIFPYCEQRACHNCRPTFRDRTWLKFDEIFENHTIPTIDFGTDNRPLTSPAIVSSLGIREPKRRRQRPLLHSFDSMGITRARSGKRTLESATSNGIDSLGLADPGEVEGKGLRHTIKRAFREMLMSRRDSVASTRSSINATRPSRRTRLQKEASTEDSMEDDLGLWKDVNEKLLMEASHVRLPGRDGHDGLDAQAEEVEVLDGVAVTEEAVEARTADVIMSV